MLTIIIPTLNESKTDYLSQILKAYKTLVDVEILCVDGGSHDNTLEVINASQARLIETDISSRAGRLNLGIQQAKYELVLLHHPRSVVQLAGIRSLVTDFMGIEWGAFTHQFNVRHPLLSFTSWYSNHVRGDRRGVYYLDHCIFAQKQLLLDIGLLPEIDIFEDTELCLQLKKKARGVRLPFISETSAIRFQTAGIYSQALKNQYLKWQYYFNRSDKAMNKLYEKGLELNTEYEDPKK